MGQRTGLDETLAFTALLELDPEGFGKLGDPEATAMRQQLQEDFYASPAKNIYEYTKGWLAARETAAQGRASGNVHREPLDLVPDELPAGSDRRGWDVHAAGLQEQYAENTPEYRVAQAPKESAGLTDQELLTKAGWVPNDGTDLRDQLLAQYRASEPVQRFEEGLRGHAMDWAYNGMRSGMDHAERYGQHIVDMHRAGDLTPETSHKVEYHFFFSGQREPQGPEVVPFEELPPERRAQRQPG